MLPIHAIDGVRSTITASGIELLTLQTPAMEATLSLFGGQLLGWRTPDAPPLLYLSPLALAAPGLPLRGGIPICWPWFAKQTADPNAVQHGVARDRPWTLLTLERAGDAFDVVLAGPRHGALSCTVHYHLGTRVDMTLETHNHGTVAQEYSATLHSYFAVGAAQHCVISGLGGRRYFDKLTQRDAVFTEDTQVWPGGFDRIVYTGDDVCLHDPVWQRCIRVGSRGSGTMVIWNPGPERAVAQLLPGSWRDFICVESANAGDDARLVPAGATHALTTTFAATAMR
jgi:glucose-6-phosphate 1-epimerase